MDTLVTLLNELDTIEDPRSHNHNYEHNLSDILVITILAVLCGSDNYQDIREYSVAKEQWLRTYLSLKNGVPSYWTFRRVFELLQPEKLETLLTQCAQRIKEDIPREVIAVDGKSLRGSANKRKKSSALHLVHAWATEQKMLLAQVKTEIKSNEITAIPKLLEMIDISGHIVTIDAMGCQQDIAAQIVRQNADYVLSLKDNQHTLYEDVKSIFALGESRQYKKMLNRRVVEKSKGHGRQERRRYTIISARDEVAFKLRWPHLESIGMLEVKRTENHQTEYSTRYFISSLKYEEIDLFSKAVRQHWSVEVPLHWSLDVVFREDHNQVKDKTGALNLATVRRIAINLLNKGAKNRKVGLTAYRKKLGWNDESLLNILRAA